MATPSFLRTTPPCSVPPCCSLAAHTPCKCSPKWSPRDCSTLGRSLLPDGKFLVTERPGRLRTITPDGTLGAPIQGLPAIAVGGQGGLLDVVLDSDFARNRTLYFCFAEPGLNGSNSTALGQGATVTRRKAAGKRPDHLQPATEESQPAALWLPHRRAARWHAAAHTGRALFLQGRSAEPAKPPGQDRAHSQGWQRASGQPLCGPQRRPA